MAVPTTREEFKQFCLRALGKPVIKINVDDDQVEDAIDFSLKMFSDYHYDASDKIYFKYLIEAGNKPDKVYRVTVGSGGTGYANGESLVFTSTSGSGAVGTVVTNGSGVIQSVNLTNNGDSYATAPTVTITTSGGSNASLTAELGGYVEMPENVMGVVNIFDSGLGTSVTDMFSIQYQLVANDLLALTSQNLAPYVMMMTHLAEIQQWLVGRKPIRYNRYKNKLYIDTNWEALTNDTYLIAEAYQVLDPDEFPKIWADQWLQEYCTAQIKKRWGNNLKKFDNMPMAGGIKYNGQKIWDEAVAEIAELKSSLINDYSLPATDMIG